MITAVTISKRGLINLPSKTRKKLGLKPGDELWLSDEEGDAGIIKLYRIPDLKDLQEKSRSHIRMLDILYQAQVDEIEREMR